MLAVLIAPHVNDHVPTKVDAPGRRRNYEGHSQWAFLRWALGTTSTIYFSCNQKREG